MRFTVMTQNLWNTIRWDERKECVRSFFRLYSPDILCLQEVRPELLSWIDESLPDYSRIQDPFVGWTNEGSIYYKKSLFTEVCHGEVFLDMPEHDRRLFWARLKNPDGHTIFVSTVHLTWQGNADEVATGMTYRHKESIIVGNALKELVLDGEGAIICGDFNDPLHPVETIKGITGMKEVFWILGQMAPVTFPCSPPSEELNLVESIDKMMINDRLRVLMADSPHYRLAGAAASDHWSVEALFEY